MKLPKLHIITNSTQADDLETTVVRCLRAGAKLIQLREKHLPHAQQLALAGHLVELCHQHGAELVINTHADVARASGADGVHRPAHGPGVADLRATMGQACVVGVSAHSLTEARAAEAQGADYVTLSPIFETASKPGYGPALGIDELVRVCEAVEIPVFALAGITPQRVQACLDAGAHGVAVMGGVMRAVDVDATVRAYLEALEAA